MGPKRAISVVSEKVGGMMSADSPCSLSQNERPVSYLESCSGSGPQSNSQDPIADQMFAVMQHARIEDRSKNLSETVALPLSQHLFSHRNGSLMTSFGFIQYLVSSNS